MDGRTKFRWWSARRTDRNYLIVAALVAAAAIVFPAVAGATGGQGGDGADTDPVGVDGEIQAPTELRFWKTAEATVLFWTQVGAEPDGWRVWVGDRPVAVATRSYFVIEEASHLTEPIVVEALPAGVTVEEARAFIDGYDAAAGGKGPDAVIPEDGQSEDGQAEDGDPADDASGDDGDGDQGTTEPAEAGDGDQGTTEPAEAGDGVGGDEIGPRSEPLQFYEPPDGDGDGGGADEPGEGATPPVGDGGAEPPAAGEPGDGGPVAPSTDGRSFLVAMYSNDASEIPSYTDYLGYAPEATYNNSYQDDHHHSCGQPISGLDHLNGYPVVADVFTALWDFGSDPVVYEDCYRQLFQSMAGHADHLYAVRIDSEYNLRGDAPSAEQFTRSFDYMVAIAEEYLPERVKYIYNPNIGHMEAAGPEWVPASADIIGIDAYNNPTWCGGRSSEACAAEKFDPDRPGSIGYWTRIAQERGLPVALPEWGDDFGDGEYIGMVADWAYDDVLITEGVSNNVVYLGYWDSNEVEDGHLRGAALEMYRNRFGEVAYSGSYWTPLLPTTSFRNYG